MAAAAAGRPRLNGVNGTATVSFPPSGDPTEWCVRPKGWEDVTADRPLTLSVASHRTGQIGVPGSI
jgi:hypothetical protein